MLIISTSILDSCSAQPHTRRVRAPPHPRRADGAELRGRQLARLSRGSTENRELAGALQPFRQARCAGPGLMESPGVVQEAREETPPRRSDRVSCVS